MFTLLIPVLMDCCQHPKNFQKKFYDDLREVPVSFIRRIVVFVVAFFLPRKRVLIRLQAHERLIHLTSAICACSNAAKPCEYHVIEALTCYFSLL